MPACVSVCARACVYVRVWSQITYDRSVLHGIHLLSLSLSLSLSRSRWSYPMNNRCPDPFNSAGQAPHSMSHGAVNYPVREVTRGRSLVATHAETVDQSVWPLTAILRTACTDCCLGMLKHGKLQLLIICMSCCYGFNSNEHLIYCLMFEILKINSDNFTQKRWYQLHTIMLNVQLIN